MHPQPVYTNGRSCSVYRCLSVWLRSQMPVFPGCHLTRFSRRPDAGCYILGPLPSAALVSFSVSGLTAVSPACKLCRSFPAVRLVATFPRVARRHADKMRERNRTKRTTHSLAHVAFVPCTSGPLSDPSRDRTCDTCLNRAPLYLLSYWIGSLVFDSALGVKYVSSISFASASASFRSAMRT